MIYHGRILCNDIDLSAILNDIGSYDTRDSSRYYFDLKLHVDTDSCDL